MKTKIYLLLAFLAVFGKAVKAQQLINLRHNGQSTFYTSVDTTLVYAQNGDTIYLPGFVFAVNNNTITIDKELHIVGVGHNPDSTLATGYTYINASIYFVSGANNSSVTGIYLNGGLTTGTNTTNEDVDYINISRCHIGGSFGLSRLSNNWSVVENIIDGNLSGMTQSSNQPYAQMNYFSNNILVGFISLFGPNNIFRNNISFFYYYNSYYYWNASSMDGMVSCTFENNIFLMGGMSFQYANYGGISSSIFNNNLFIFGFGIPGTCVGTNNIISQTQSSIFINQSGNSFSYTQDYHIQNSSPGHNGGTDGTDVGIYGGAFPWKAGSVPFNPHVITKAINATTNQNGDLPVNIEVGAQNH